MEWTPQQCNNNAVWDRFVTGANASASEPNATLTNRGCKGVSLRNRLAVGATLCTMLSFAAGCHLAVNPYHDEMATVIPVTTPSATGVREANVTARTIRPLGEAKTVRAKSGVVIHGPLYFEDPVEESGSDDGQFAITHEDFFAFWSMAFRFPLNTVLLPISALITPPSTVMASDGALSRKVSGQMYDATPLQTPPG